MRTAKLPPRWCQWCTAKDGEKAFFKRHTCRSCDRMRCRDKCASCDGPRMRGRCSRCDPPPQEPPSKGGEWVEIILLDASTDEERTVYRAPTSNRSEGVVSFQFLGQRRREEEPVVLSLPREQFLRVLC